MNLAVVTRVADPKSGGNMALNMDSVWFDSGRGGWPPAELLPASDVLGPAILNLRGPVFKVGEIIFLDANDRDQFGRQPSRWDVDIQHVSSLEEAEALVGSIVGDSPREED